ncbi:hypothetical protein I3760_08G129800 [Carya illinoinensis]|nr:hypothetical protein I3760_08G129800 [Carya illinoinensis]
MESSTSKNQKCIINRPYIPTKIVDEVNVKKEEEEFNRKDNRLYTLNLSAMNLLYNTLNGNEFNRIMTCATMNDDKSISSILTALGKIYSNIEIERKILNSLPKRWE